MIELSDVFFCYGKNKIFQHLNLVFKKGKSYGIIGVNGCGKTTLLKLISGEEAITSGEILVDDRPKSAYRKKEYAQKISVLSQENYITQTTVYDYASAGRYPYTGIFGKLSEIDKSFVDSAVARTRLENKKYKKMYEISGGEKQRARIAMNLVQDASYILWDEPTTYLDMSAKFEIMHIIKEMTNSGKCVIAVLHDICLALKYCDFIVVIDKMNGSTQSLIPKDAVNNGIIDSVFGIRCIKNVIEGKTEYFIKESD